MFLILYSLVFVIAFFFFVITKRIQNVYCTRGGLCLLCTNATCIHTMFICTKLARWFGVFVRCVYVCFWTSPGRSESNVTSTRDSFISRLLLLKSRKFKACLESALCCWCCISVGLSYVHASCKVDSFLSHSLSDYVFFLPLLWPAGVLHFHPDNVCSEDREKVSTKHDHSCCFAPILKII